MNRSPEPVRRAALETLSGGSACYAAASPHAVCPSQRDEHYFQTGAKRRVPNRQVRTVCSGLRLADPAVRHSFAWGFAAPDSSAVDSHSRFFGRQQRQPDQA